MTFPLITDQVEPPGHTFAVADEGLSFAASLLKNPGDTFGANYAVSERQTRLVNNVFALDQAREEIYDRHIAAVKAATGQQLENPERGGYSLNEGELRRLSRDGPIDPRAYQRQQFERKFNEVQAANPDKIGAFNLDLLDEQARTISRIAEDEKAPSGNQLTDFIASLAGGIVGSRRDPLFVGSLFAGPTSAAGKAAFTRIASASLFQGLYNAGLTAAEQPAVQAWRAEIGARSGVQPALENVGMAFIFGMIPGAGIQGIKEAWPKEGLATPLRRVLAGHPEPGDLEAVHAGLTPDAPREAAALAAGAESVAADRATLTIPEPKGVTPELHNDMLAAALKRADDPGAASPEAVHAVNEMERGEPGKPPATEIEQRITAAEPKSEREAVLAADEALDDIGRREGAAVLRDSMDRLATDREVARAERLAGEPVKGFTTAKGSTYEVHEDGATTRNKSFHPEHGEADQGAQPRSDATFYVSMNDAIKLGEFQSQGIKKAVAQTSDGRWGVKYLEGKDTGKFERRTVVEAEKEPGVGLVPVELWKDGTRVHFGNEITDIERAPAAKTPSKDPIGKIPWVDDSGNPKLLTQKAAAAIGERDDMFAMLVRSCK